MTQKSSIPTLAEALLTQYDFDLGGDAADQLVAQWETNYQVEWVALAVVEALYLGRYKAVSVQQILSLWERRGQPVYHFNSEFQNIITRNILTNLTSQTDIQTLEQPLEQQTTPSSSELESPEQPKSTSPSSNPFNQKSTKVAQELVTQIPVQPAQYKIKHTDFYAKLKALAEKTQTMRSHFPQPNKVKQIEPPEEEESAEE